MHVDQESVDLDGLADFVAGAAAAFDGVERVAEEVEPHHRGFAALPSDRAVWGGMRFEEPADVAVERFSRLSWRLSG
jgi:hypothetical protein